MEVNEELNLLLSDGIYSGNEEEYLVIEIEKSLIDFDEIIESELNSIKVIIIFVMNVKKYGDNLKKILGE